MSTDFPQLSWNKLDLKNKEKLKKKKKKIKKVKELQN